jgi:hypothetical protein
MRHSLLLSSFLLAGLGACSDSGFTFTPPATDFANPSISGRICHPSGSEWLADAVIYTNIYERVEGVQGPGRVVDVKQTTTDTDGYWTISDLAPGEHEFIVAFGSQTLNRFKVTLRPDENLILPEPACFDPQAMNIAVISGDYDNMQDMLERMGFINFTLIDGNDGARLVDFLSNPENLDPFDVVFFNGGHVEEDIFYTSNPSNRTPQNVRAVLEDYVWEGGSVISSDWAYDVVELVWPNAIDFLGDDSVPNAAQLGEYAIVDAVVTDSSLAAFIGKELVEIEYDLPVWPLIIDTESYVAVHLRGNVTYREGTQSTAVEMVPLLVSFNGGAGRVGVSTFRVAANQSDDMRGIFQYMLYNVSQ